MRVAISLFLAFIVGFGLRGLLDELLDAQSAAAPLVRLTVAANASSASASSPPVSSVRDAVPRHALIMTAMWGASPNDAWAVAAGARLFVPGPLDFVVVSDAQLANESLHNPLTQALGVDFVDVLRARGGDKKEELPVLRFAAFRDVLRARLARGVPYTHVLVTDARDVTFQGDPFAHVEPDTVIFSLEAGLRIREQVHNAAWVRQLAQDGSSGRLPRSSEPYDGCKMLAAIGDEPISCSGVTLGTTSAMLAYLNDMSEMIDSVPVRLSLGVDQGAHNVLVHHMWKADARRRLMDVYSSPVFTAGNVRPNDIEIDALGRLRHARGMPAVVHQLDRAWKSFLLIAAHWRERLDFARHIDQVRERYREAATWSRGTHLSIGRADPFQTDEDAALRLWPTELFRATNASWCGAAPGFARHCGAPLPASALRPNLLPTTTFSFDCQQ
jgi:hypothetical protein